MAGSAVIGALRVELGLNSAAFDKGIKDASKRLGAFGSFMQQFGKQIVASLSLAGVVASIKSVINEADNLNKAAQKFGVPVEKLSELKYAADLADVSLEALGVGFKKLSKNMAEVAAGGGKQAAEAFLALGISIKEADGSLKSSEQVFNEVADAFNKYADGANKTALAQNIFGKSGADLIPLLNAGSAGLKEQAQEARNLGVVISTKTAVASEAFNDNLTRLQAAFGGIVKQVTAALLPTLVNLSNQFVDLVRDGSLVEQTSKAISFAFKEAARFGVELNAIIAETSRILQFLKDFTRTNTFEGVAAAWKSMNDDLFKINQDMQMRIRQLNDDTVGNLLSGVDAFIAKMKGASQEKPEAPLVRTNEALDEMKRRAAEIEDEFRRITDSAKQVFESTRTPLEQYNLKMAELNDLLNVGAISWDTYQRAIKQAGDDILGTSTLLDDSFSALGDTFKNAFDGLLDKSFDLQDSLLNLLKTMTDLALNDFFRILQQNNRNAGGGGGIFESIIGFISGSIPGFASGGSMRVGGSGAIDSKLAMFKVSPNETIDVRKPGQDRTAEFAAPNFIVEDRRRNGEMSMSKDPTGDTRLVLRDAINRELPGLLRPILAQQYGINTVNKRR